jgi:hypothetical protein
MTPRAGQHPIAVYRGRCWHYPDLTPDPTLRLLPGGEADVRRSTAMFRFDPHRGLTSTAASLEAHQREPDNTGHQEPSDVPPTRGDGIADGGVPINDDRHCNDP